MFVEVVEFSDFVILNDALETTSAQLIHDVERVGFCQVACRAWLVLLDEGTHFGVPLILQSDAPLMIALQRLVQLGDVLAYLVNLTMLAGNLFLDFRLYGSNRLCNCDGMDECLPHEEKAKAADG